MQAKRLEAEHPNDLGGPIGANPVVGNSRFLDDEWDLTNMVPGTFVACRRRIDFAKIEQPGLRETYRQYAYWKLGHAKASTLTSQYSKARKFLEYCASIGAQSLSMLTEDDLARLPEWLEKSGLSLGSQGHVLAIADEMIRIGQKRGWDVPTSFSMTQVKSRPEWPKGLATHSKKTAVIPDETMRMVLECALKEKDPVNRGLVIVLSQTGLRASEAISIMPGCIEPAPAGMHTMTVLVSKTIKQGPTPHKVLVNSLVVDAVRELEENALVPGGPLFTAMANGRVTRITTSGVANRLRRFCLRWGITTPDGNPAVHPHMFRTTFVRSLVLQGMPLAFIMEHYAHVSIEMTAHYLQLSREDLRAAWGKAILSPSSAIAGKRASQIRSAVARELKARCEEDADEVIASLAESMSFNPLPTGICLYDLRRGPCAKGESCFFYNCPNYVTEKRFYPILKRELDLVEKEMARLKELGRDREWQRQRAKQMHLEPLVRELEDQINEQQEH